jgi:hypothetical protein
LRHSGDVCYDFSCQLSTTVKDVPETLNIQAQIIKCQANAHRCEGEKCRRFDWVEKRKLRSRPNRGPPPVGVAAAEAIAAASTAAAAETTTTATIGAAAAKTQQPKQ